MQDGDIVINSTGTGTLGRVGFYRSTANRNNIPIVPDSHVTVIRSYRELHAFYLYAFMKANQSELEKKGEGSTNQKELKPLTLKESYVPIPPYEEQLRIVMSDVSSIPAIFLVFFRYSLNSISVVPKCSHELLTYIYSSYTLSFVDAFRGTM